MLVGGLAWASFGLSTAWFRLSMGGWETEASIWRVAVLFAAGAFLAFAPALWLARFASAGRTPSVRFAAHLLFLATVTVAVTAVLFALVYRGYYAQWHEEMFTYVWFLQFIFTSASAVYQFAVLGLRAYLPFGLVALPVFAWALSRATR